ncbi:acyltransferase [Frondihabitans sp. VKM Ac-2883]|uniref:acyltransferase n=1 Tax=Frondihabitans sp. VKM Ac-2883 TaxID=2783823 RepID=UPI00188BE9D9|nr:acyltransferase [Frondihabitans sp. VKM Ac-2883]MBF4575763.1 N-acetyltransferase [Frondihabitans sp. VKM Ac-2883]
MPVTNPTPFQQPDPLGILPTLHPTADVDPSAQIGGRTHVWHLAQVRENASIGGDCTIGRGAYVGAGVAVGDNCKIQNGAHLFDPATLGQGVFVGPGAVLTNDRAPRAITPDGIVKTGADWTTAGVVVHDGASIGAGAVCVAPVSIGRWALVAAGAVVTQDVPDFALVAGTPARQIGWVGRHGVRLVAEGDSLVCPISSTRHIIVEGRLEEVSK